MNSPLPVRAGSTHMRDAVRVILAWVILVGVLVPRGHANSESPLPTAVLWLTDDGLPAGDVFAMTQDRDGYLWLGMNTGLVRFDGHQFLPWGSGGEPPLPGSAVQAIAATRDGSIWAGFGDTGGVVRILNGKVISYAAGADGLADGRVAALLEDRTGALWVASGGGVSVFDRGEWRALGETGLPPAEVFSLYEDRAGALWIGTSAGVFRRPSGAARFDRVDSRFDFVQSLTEDSGGSIWITDSQQVMRRLDDAAVPAYADGIRLPTAGWRLLRARDGTIWIAALGGGLLRFVEGVGAAPAVERIRDGGTIAGSPRSLFEDRAGNVWVGMRGGGLVRLSEAVFTTDVPLEGMTNDGVRGLAASPDGSIWIATGHHLNRFSGSDRQVYDVAQTVALHVDRTGTIWVATAVEVGRFADGRVEPLSVAPGIRPERIASITTDATGRLWLCSIDQGLLTSDGGTIALYTGHPPVAGRPCYSTFADRSGRVWVGFRDGVGVVRGERLEVYGSEDGIPAGAIAAITEDSTGAVWLSTSASLARFQNGRFTSLHAAHGLPGKIVPTLVEDGEGQIWVGVNSGSEIVRFDRREVDAVATDDAHPLRYALYDASDGLQGELHWTSRPGGVRGSDGRLWFVTGRGVAIIDPRRRSPNREPALLRIERVTVGDRAIPADPQVSLPHAAPIQIDYTALSLSAGSKLRFRYLLEGRDSAWVDAGARRQVSYRALPAGHYRFRVAATGDGDWSDTEASWAFVIQPPFYQAPWFYAVAVIGVAVSLWGYWQLRLRTVRRQFAVVVAERTRVSREIHDTLLQSLGAVGLELEAVARELDTSEHRSRETLRRLRRRLGGCIREARQSVWELRSPLLDLGRLEESLRVLVEDISASGALEATLTVKGRPRECGHDVAHNLLRIAQEAANNAVRHGAPDHVRIELAQEADSLILRVSDDGSGFTPPGAADDASGEHWGLVNMQERASRIGGRLGIVSEPGRGTVVEARVPLGR